MNHTDIAILNIPGADYCYIISRISKNEAINFMQNIDMTEKSGTFGNIKIHYIHKNGLRNIKVW